MDCLNCKKEVKYNGEDLVNFGFGPCKAKPGNHVVEPVTFYHPGARDIQDLKDRRKFAPVIILVPSYESQDPKTGNKTKTRGVSVQFNDGRYETGNPEEIFYLRQKPDIAEGDEGLKMWQKIYLTPEQLNKVNEATLADQERRIRENQDLLAQVKANQASGKQASVTP